MLFILSMKLVTISHHRTSFLAYFFEDCFGNFIAFFAILPDPFKFVILFILYITSIGKACAYLTL